MSLYNLAHDNRVHSRVDSRFGLERTRIRRGRLQAACAGCHEVVNPRILPRDVLQKMPAARILRALDFGLMMNVGSCESGVERLEPHDVQ